MRHSVPLPRGWAATELGQIRVDLSRTLDPRQYPDEDFELYSVPSFADGEPEIVRGSAIGSTKMTLTPGTVVVCKINPRINRVWVVGDRSPHKKIGSGEWIPFFPVDGVTPHFLAYYLQRDHFRNFLAARVSGVGGSLMRVRPTTLDEYPLPIPSVSEQQRIVEAIESYLTRLDNAVALLGRVEENLKRYRASVLKAAVEGRLVPTEAELARREGRSYEPASELLKRILAERKTHWIEDAAEKARAKAAEKARTAGQPWTARDDAATLEKERAKAAKQYKEPAAPDTTDLPELPEGWCWTRIEAVGDVQLGRQRSPKDHHGSHMRPYLRVANVYEDRIDTTDILEMNFTPYEFETYRLRPGDILLNEGQSLELIGRPAMYNGEVPGACFQNTLVRFTSSIAIERRYALMVFLAYMHSGVFQRIARWTTNIAHLGAGRFASLAFPLPPAEEQARIVAEVDRILGSIAAVAGNVQSGTCRAMRLRQSTLKWAFEGKLVEQDPNDEAAEALLERIRAERAAAGADKPRASERRSAE